MKLAMLLSILGLALPTAALASGVDFDTGKFESGTITGTFTTSIDTTEVGSLNTVTIDTGKLVKLPTCTSGFSCYDFKGGSTTVVHDGVKVFSDGLQGGLTIKGNGAVALSASLIPNGTVAEGSAVATIDFSGHKILSGSSDVSFATRAGPGVTPEPGTLGLLGTGLIGLVGIARRKLKV